MMGDRLNKPFEWPNPRAGVVQRGGTMADLINELEFSVKNLGIIRKGSFKPQALTLFCGPNNSGKTWVMYSLYLCYKRMSWLWKEGKEEDEERLVFKTLDEFNQRLKQFLPRLFNAPRKQMQGAIFKLNNADLSLQLIQKDWGRHNVFLMPSERSGLHLFFREVSTRRTALLHHASQEDIDLGALLRDVIRSPYAMPIADYIDWLNSLINLMGDRPKKFHQFAEHLENEIVRGVYKVDKVTSDITFKPYDLKRNGKEPPKLRLHMTSSTVKSLFGLWFYLEYQAEPGDILMIDEPELNVHPENQRKIARLLARLVNAGLRIVMSTHSDYIVRELNTLIMLSQEEAEELRKEHGYEQEETLRTDQIAAYLFDNQTITPFKVTADDGIHGTTFDKVIDDLNKVNDDVYYSLQEEKEAEYV